MFISSLTGILSTSPSGNNSEHVREILYESSYSCQGKGLIVLVQADTNCQ